MSALPDERFAALAPPDARTLRDLGLPWFAKEGGDYFTDDVLRVTTAEATAYAEAAHHLYQRYEEACDAVLGGSYRPEFGLSPELWALAEYTWRDRARHPHLYGRFDLAGGLADAPIRLIEYNADTSTVLAEAALVQHRQASGHRQWNSIVDELTAAAGRMPELRPEVDPLALVATLGFGEDDDTGRLFQTAWSAAGLQADLAHLPGVTFDAREGVFRELNPEEWLHYGALVKLFPWDFLADEEPGLLGILDGLIRAGELLVLNPAYTSLMQSKAMLVELHRLFPDDPYLLPAGFADTRPSAGALVEKPIFGREGGNVSIASATGVPLSSTDGDYGEQSRIWQAYAELQEDSDGDRYQAGVYTVAGEAVGLGFRRRDGLIIDGDAEFVGHVIAG